MVSFFFTPIYMFMLCFLVLFGPKKGVITTYKSFWSFQYYINILSLVYNNKVFLNVFFKKLNQYIIYRFQFTILTCRTTIYVLFFFWLFFFHLGEYFLILLFNIDSISDGIMSHTYLSVKSHTNLYLNSLSSYLNNELMLLILFFSTAGLLFLINLKFTFNYSYFKYTSYLDILFILSIVLFVI